MITSKTIKKMVGNPFVPKGIRDSDRDGVMNMLDCAPRNPRKQGLRHRVAKRIAKLVPGKKLREEAVSYVSHKELLAEARKKARREAELEEAAETAKFRVQERARRRREFIKTGGLMGATRRGMVSTAKALEKATRPSPATRKVMKAKGKKKKGKKGKRAITTVPAPKQMPRLEDFKLNL